MAVGKWSNPTEAVSSSVKSFGEVSLLEESRKEQALTLEVKVFGFYCIRRSAFLFQ